MHRWLQRKGTLSTRNDVRYLGYASDGHIRDGPRGADGSLQHRLAVQELEVAGFAQDHLPAGALAGIVEGPACSGCQAETHPPHTTRAGSPSIMSACGRLCALYSGVCKAELVWRKNDPFWQQAFCTRFSRAAPATPMHSGQGKEQRLRELASDQCLAETVG